MTQMVKVKEACRILDVCRATLYTLMREGQLPSAKIRGGRRIPLREVERYLDRKTKAKL